MEVFLRELGKAYPGEEIIVVLDGAPGHTSGWVSWPKGMEALSLPSYSPELNPAERLFRGAEGKALQNRVFESVEEIMEALSGALRAYWEEPSKLAKLTGYEWWLRSLPDMQTLT